MEWTAGGDAAGGRADKAATTQGWAADPVTLHRVMTALLTSWAARCRLWRGTNLRTGRATTWNAGRSPRSATCADPEAADERP